MLWPALRAEERQQVIGALEKALQPFGHVRVRSWGDVVSVELAKDKQTIFSFQVARRSVELQPPLPGPWPGGIRIDSFDDLVASKMVALIERGAPRDFRDIYTLCQSHQYSIERCWELWANRQEAAGEDADRRRAALAIQTHISRLEQARPLEKIADETERSAAAQLRQWFIAEFIHGLAD